MNLVIIWDFKCLFRLFPHSIIIPEVISHPKSCILYNLHTKIFANSEGFWKVSMDPYIYKISLYCCSLCQVSKNRWTVYETVPCMQQLREGYIYTAHLHLLSNVHFVTTPAPRGVVKFGFGYNVPLQNLKVDPYKYNFSKKPIGTILGQILSKLACFFQNFL